MSDLDQIAAQADTMAATTATELATTAGQQAPDQEAQKPPTMSNTDAVAMMLRCIREGLVAMLGLTSLQTSLDEPKLKACAEAIGPVLDKHNINLGGSVGGPEIGAALTAGPILVGAYRLAMAELKQRAQAKQLERQAQPGVSMSEVYDYPPHAPAPANG